MPLCTHLVTRGTALAHALAACQVNKLRDQDMSEDNVCKKGISIRGFKPLQILLRLSIRTLSLE